MPKRRLSDSAKYSQSKRIREERQSSIIMNHQSQPAIPVTNQHYDYNEPIEAINRLSIEPNTDEMQESPF